MAEKSLNGIRNERRIVLQCLGIRIIRFLASRIRKSDVFVWDRNSFLAYLTRFFAIFTSVDKPYLTYLYPTHGVDKKRITIRAVNILVVLEVT